MQRLPSSPPNHNAIGHDNYNEHLQGKLIFETFLTAFDNFDKTITFISFCSSFPCCPDPYLSTSCACNSRIWPPVPLLPTLSSLLHFFQYSPTGFPVTWYVSPLFSPVHSAWRYRSLLCNKQPGHLEKLEKNRRIKHHVTSHLSVDHCLRSTILLWSSLSNIKRQISIMLNFSAGCCVTKVLNWKK